MKRMTIVLGMLLWTAVCFSQTLEAPSNGDGSEGNPYEIANLNNLYWLSQTDSVWDLHYVQTADIDASPTKDWDGGKGFSPIGPAYSNNFSGTYDGQGYTIDSLYINRSSQDYIGLFGFVYYSANIKNLDVSDADITGNNIVAGIAAYFTGERISNCFSSGAITGTGYGDSDAGGICGYLRAGKIVNSYSNASVEANSDRIGGLVGYCKGTIDSSYATGNVTGGYDYIGGLVGVADFCVIKNSYSTGNVFGDNTSGGFVGRNNKSSISNCYSMGDVTRSSGSAYSSFGGFCGENTDKSEITRCYSTGEVIYSGATNPTDKGFVGSEGLFTSYTGNFFDSDSSNQTIDKNGAANAKTHAAMTSSCTFLSAGWDFKGLSWNGTEDKWTINSTNNNGYPALEWQGYSNTVPTSCAPAITIDSIFAIAKESVTAKAIVMSSNNASVTERGFCIDTTPQPDISDKKISSGSDTGTYTSEITGLVPNTTYYVRAYATNSEGTSYSLDKIFFTVPFEGKGTASVPYEIDSLNELKMISENEIFWDNHYIQTADIDASDTYTWNDENTSTDIKEGFSPIGIKDAYGYPFSGSYNGNGHTIDSLYINRGSTDFMGLFGGTKNAEIDSLGLTNVNITGNKYVGGLVSYAEESNISGSYTSGTVTGNFNFVGGVVGVFYSGKINSCYTTCDVYGPQYVGGFVGEVDGEITNCYSTGDVSRNSGSNTDIGAFCGYAKGGVKYSYATGNVYCDTLTNKGFFGGEWGGYAYFEHNFFDSTASNQSSDAIGGATPLSTSEMQDICMYLNNNWDMMNSDYNGTEDIWGLNLNQNNGYPFLKWQGYTHTENDTILPSITTVDTMVYLNTSGQATIDTSYIKQNITDNCGIKNVYLNTQNFNCSDVGDTTVWLYAEDLYGNIDSASATVTVKDTILPTLSTTSAVVYLDSSGNASVTTNKVISTASDNCGLADTSLNKSVFDCSMTGDNPIDVTVTDAEGNTVTQTATVTVEDTITPTVSCITDQIVEEDGNDQYIVSGNEFDPASASDNCGFTLTNDYNNASSLDSATIPVGDTVITWTITDNSGLTDTCSFTVQVDDLTGVTVTEYNEKTVYPNPTEGKVWINTETGSGTAEIEVIDMTGSVIISKQQESQPVEIDLSQQPAGIYYLRIQNGEHVSVQKVIKQ